MLRNFYPYAYVNSVWAIDYAALYRQGYRAIIFDIDNTLVHHGDDANQKIIDLFQQIHAIGLKTLLLSNNNQVCIERFTADIPTLYIADADKPNPDNYLQALAMLGTAKHETLMIGDQLFTDIWGANRSGIASVLVRFMQRNPNENIGKRRKLERLLLNRYQKSKYRNRIQNISADGVVPPPRRRNFSDINPLFYQISYHKEVLKRHLQDWRRKTPFARHKNPDRLPETIHSHQSRIIRTGQGIDPVSQENKAVNLELASRQINGIIIKPNEVFSFWKLVGKASKRKGYKAGRVISQGSLKTGLGGGLCNLANTINLLVLHSPLEIVELHTHSDALDPSAERNRQPFAAGTSVSYNYVDYRFKNNTQHDVQVLVWCENGELKAELRSEQAFLYRYELVEEEHCFVQKNGAYYRQSKIYKQTLDKTTGEVLHKELVWDNHSKVMYDFDLIPKELIKED